MNFETGNMLFFVGCVTVLLLVGGPDITEARFEFGAYCRKLCAWGKGGNLCKCNAVHFAGKRGEADDLRQEQEMLGDGGDTYYPDLPEFMDKDEDEEPKQSSLDNIRKIYHQMETMNRMHGPSKTTQMILDTLQKMLTSANRKSAQTDLS